MDFRYIEGSFWFSQTRTYEIELRRNSYGEIAFDFDSTFMTEYRQTGGDFFWFVRNQMIDDVIINDV